MHGETGVWENIFLSHNSSRAYIKLLTGTSIASRLLNNVNTSCSLKVVESYIKGNSNTGSQGTSAKRV